MEVQAYIKNLKISPKKLRFLLAEIKKKKPADALDHLFYTPKKSAKIFYKAIKSAVDNAKSTLKINENLLKFKLLTVEEGRRLKRFQPGGRGTPKSIVKRYAHIKIILTADVKEPIVEKKLPVQKKIKGERLKLPSARAQGEGKTQIYGTES